MNNLWRALALIAAFSAGFQPAQAQAPAPAGQARFAFVIGNDDYDDGELPTAANDASLVADAYKTAGFEVTGARNLDQETLRSAYREFLEKVAAAGPNSVAAVYVSGYGVQSQGENYFIPPGARVQRESDLALNAVRISDLTRALSGLPSRGRIIALDIAYAPPFAESWPSLAPGLAMIEPEPDTLIAFNAAPGAIAPVAQPPYGPYAQALAEMLREPGLPIDEVFASVRARVAELTKGAQAPWSESRLSQDIVMLERGPDAPPPVVTAQRMEARRALPIAQMSAQDAYAAALDRDNIAAYEEFLAAYGDSHYANNVRNMLATRREARTWRSTLNVNTPNAYWSYLSRYPKGPHANEARRRLARFSAAQEPPASFVVIDYPFAPPPREEIIFLEDPRPRYFVVHEAPVVIYAPPPRWWRPPPPPVYVEENYFFLPAPVSIVEQPVWLAPPRYVAPPPPPVWIDERRSIVPYVAIPAALAAGIVAGKIIQNRRDERRQDAAARDGRDGRDSRRDAAVAPRQFNPQFMPPVARPVRPVANLPVTNSEAIAPRQSVAPAMQPAAPVTAPALQRALPAMQPAAPVVQPPALQRAAPASGPAIGAASGPATAPAIGAATAPAATAPAIAPAARTPAPGALPPLPRTGAKPDVLPGAQPGAQPVPQPGQRGMQRAQPLPDLPPRQGAPGSKPAQGGPPAQGVPPSPSTAPAIAPPAIAPSSAPAMKPAVPPAAIAEQRRMEEMQRRRTQEEGRRDTIRQQQQQRQPQEQTPQRLRESAPAQRQQAAPDPRQQQQQQQQQQMQEQRQQQMQQQQQRQQQMQEQRQQQMQQQRQQQQQEQRQQQMQEQRQQQMQQQQQRQQQQQEQRQQQMQQQRQQQQQQQRPQQEQRQPDRSRGNPACGAPGQPPCR